jgi:hypothetical protein
MFSPPPHIPHPYPHPHLYILLPHVTPLILMIWISLSHIPLPLYHPHIPVPYSPSPYYCTVPYVPLSSSPNSPSLKPLLSPSSLFLFVK